MMPLRTLNAIGLIYFPFYMHVHRKHDANVLHVCIYALTWVQMDVAIRVGTSISFFYYFLINMAHIFR